MKKRYSYILLLFLPLISLGQVQIGVKAGYIYYWFTEPDDGHFTYNYNYSHNAYSIAFSLRQRSLHTFNHGFEIEYTNRSFAVNSNEPGLGSGGVVDYYYTIGNIYIRFQPQFTFGSKVKFFFYPGIYFGTLLHSSIHGTEYSWHMGYPPKTDTIIGTAYGYYPNFEFGILLGVGIEIPVYKNLNIVYENNFSMNLLPVANAWGSEKIKMLNLNFELGLAYTLKRGKAKSSEK
jgi:hypothetical protein